MAWINPQAADFKAFFVRDFSYNTDPSLGVTDGDITKALQECNNDINPDIFDTQSEYFNAYLYLAAHYVSLDIRMGGQGIWGQGNFVQQAKGVGPANVTIAIPPEILRHPQLSAYCVTNYGVRYAIIIYPLAMTGQCFSVKGGARP